MRIFKNLEEIWQTWKHFCKNKWQLDSNFLFNLQQHIFSMIKTQNFINVQNKKISLKYSKAISIVK